MTQRPLFRTNCIQRCAASDISELGGHSLSMRCTEEDAGRCCWVRVAFRSKRVRHIHRQHAQRGTVSVFSIHKTESVSSKLAITSN